MRSSISERGNVVRSFFFRAGICCLTLLVGNAAFAQLEITEVMFNPLDENVWEWIEVRNTGGSAIDLNGSIGANFNDQELSSPNPTVDNALAQNTIIGPGEVAVLYDANYGSGQSPAGNPNNFVDANFRSAWNLSPSVPLIGANFWPTLSNTTGSPTQSVGFWADASKYSMDISAVEDDPINEPGVFTNRVTSFANTLFSVDYSGATFPSVDGMSSIAWSGNGSNSNGAQWAKSVSGLNNAVTSTQVDVAGFINSNADYANPGLVPAGTPATTGLKFTEIMYDPASFDVSDPFVDIPWEWVEVYNATENAIDLSGYVLDDNNSTAHSEANIASGSIAAGGVAILYNDSLTDAQFRGAWQTVENMSAWPLNLIPVSNWTNGMGLNNGNTGDEVALWSSFASYSGDQQDHVNAVVKQAYSGNSGFPDPVGASIYPFDLSADFSDGGNWNPSGMGDGLSFNPNLVSGSGGMVPLHPGGDVGSPGTFTVVAVGNPGDFDGDGDADGNDFLIWQRGNSPTGPLSPVDLAAWQGAYGTPLTAAVGAVPEPATLALLALAFAPLACGRKR